MRAIISCNPHWLACCRGGRRIARNKPGGLTRGITLRAIQATPATPAAESNPQWLLQFRASLAREDLSPATLRGYVYDLRPLPALAPGTAGRGGKPKPPKIPSLVSAWPLRQFSSSGSRWSVGPKSPEAVGCQFGVPGGVLDVAMAQIMLDRARILAVVGELIASRMAQHVRVDREVDTGLASWGGRPNGVILHGSGIGRNVEGRVSGGLPAPGERNAVTQPASTAAPPDAACLARDVIPRVSTQVCCVQYTPSERASRPIVVACHDCTQQTGRPCRGRNVSGPPQVGIAEIRAVFTFLTVQNYTGRAFRSHQAGGWPFATRRLGLYGRRGAHASRSRALAASVAMIRRNAGPLR